MEHILGLTTSQASAALHANGANEVNPTRRNTGLSLLARQFLNPIIIILIFATVISMVVGEVLDGAIILSIIIPSALLGYWQEARADRTMQELLRRIELLATVVRDGIEKRIPVRELVVGDLIVINVGDIIPADAQTIEVTNLLLDESVLTGESFPREIHQGEKIYSGTHAVGGMAKAIVRDTGEDTKFGAVVKELGTKDARTGFERGTQAFGQLLMRTMAVLVISLLAFNIVMHRPFLESLLFSLALAVGLTPQLLPVIISASLSVGARALAREKVLVKRLDAIEDLGSIDVLCSDKTGTITTGTLALDCAQDLNGVRSGDVARLALLNATLQKGFHNPLDEAIISAFPNIALNEAAFGEIPYDFTRRRLSVGVDLDAPTVITKGAFSSVLSLCAYSRVNGSVEKINAQVLEERFNALSHQGFRVLAVATKVLESHRELSANDESEMIFEGFLNIIDPPKTGIKETIKSLRANNMSLYLITGDNPLVAAHIAAQVGMASQVVTTGKDIESMTSDGLRERLKGSFIYAEVDPLAKERIVRALQDNGSRVGYFGDGINDAPALRAADVGISVDTAVDVAKSSADVVLLEKNLGVLVDGIRLGRKTFANTMKYVRVGVSAAFGNVFSMAIANIFLPFLPLLPTQILLLNFLTDFPAVMIAGDRVDDEILAKPRTWDISKIQKLMIIFGLMSTIFDLATFAVLRYAFNADESLFHSGWFVESALTELAVMLVLRTSRPFWSSRPGKGLALSSLFLAVTAIYLPMSPLASLFGFSALPLYLTASLLGMIAIYIALNEFAKRRWWD